MKNLSKNILILNRMYITDNKVRFYRPYITSCLDERRGFYAGF